MTYEIKVSKRSRYLRLRISEQGLLVSKPWGLKHSEVEAWLLSKSDWIHKHWTQASTSLPSTLSLPTRIELRFLEQTIEVRYEAADINGAKLKFDTSKQTLLVQWQTNHFENCQAALKTWLTQQAKIYLPSRLQELAQELGFSYQRCIIKNQKTRWGSCSNQGIINLNAKLLLLPKVWVDYVLIHELCHTRELNHSSRFWSLIKTYLPNYSEIHQTMKTAMSALPTWAK
ncbi:M48 family metallopeptidase [uncultured Thiothrix sp.]|uniref:M48 family metallopeptidase n=1 Tax=uncultured Thiothrix sp. TaxID=223185 RepID=UPI002639B601|nr:SprT family zinc-dependent metalloprotease [uncultured Thiothrix sp.]